MITQRRGWCLFPADDMAMAAPPVEKQQCFSLAAEAFNKTAELKDDDPFVFAAEYFLAFLYFVYVCKFKCLRTPFLSRRLLFRAWIQVYVPAPFSLYIYIDSSLWRQIKFNQNLKEHISQFCFFLLIIKLKLKKINKIPREIATINLHIIKMKINRNPIQQIKNYIKTIMIFSMI